MMLGRTAAGLYWMFRHLERAENTARLIDAGARIAITRWRAAPEEWGSILDTTGLRALYAEAHGSGGQEVDGPAVWDFLLRGEDNPSSVLASAAQARTNARAVRTALTREVFEAVNDTWRLLKARLAQPITEEELPAVLALIRERASLVRGATYGTLLRNEIFHFTRLGTYVERADAIGRILDVKYYVLLPSVQLVGGEVDTFQWETILRAASAHRAYTWLHGGDITAAGIAEFLIFDARSPRSMAYCHASMASHLAALDAIHGQPSEARARADALHDRLKAGDMAGALADGLHETLADLRREGGALAQSIETDFRFFS